MGRLEWLDTHLVHHRWEHHPLNVVRPLLRRLICDRFERSLGPVAPEEEATILAREAARRRLGELRQAAAERTAAYELLAASRNDEDEAVEAAMRSRDRDRVVD